ncbi:hypothetical protein AERO8C_150050 [Aeromonas veronii]|uniref:Uncharacterized protein n=1 Tax=Aeromonas veronii TaxID=654 RepID=A0A653KWK8_AERVE|nr:hypothetical protein AERO8C_150050 [Aeromonas veronii]
MKSVINCIAGESRLNKHSDQTRLFMLRHPLGHRIDERGQREGEKHHHGPLHIDFIDDAIFEKCLEHLHSGDGHQRVDDDELEGGKVDLAKPVAAKGSALLFRLDKLHIATDSNQDQHLGHQYKVHQGQHACNEVQIGDLENVYRKLIELHGKLHHQQYHADEDANVEGEHHQSAAIEHEIESTHENSDVGNRAK